MDNIHYLYVLTDSLILRKIVNVNVFAAGEGSHNFHYTFPWDYQSSDSSSFMLSSIKCLVECSIEALSHVDSIRSIAPSINFEDIRLITFLPKVRNIRG